VPGCGIGRRHAAGREELTVHLVRQRSRPHGQRLSGITDRWVR
jgi:hypothetical protein